MSSLARSARNCAVLTLLASAYLLLGAQDPGIDPAQEADESAAPRFGWVDVYLDSGTVRLAAYQVELAAETGAFQIVGIEGGEHAAFTEPPYYDPAALQHDRVILAAFSTDESLPAGRTRVARVHVRVEGAAPQYVAVLIVAGDADGMRIPAEIQLEEGAQP